MGADTPLPLIVAWVGFVLTALVEASISSVRRERVQGLVTEGVKGSSSLEALHLTPGGPTGVISQIKLLFLAAYIVSATVLGVWVYGHNWAWIALASLAWVAVLAATQTLVVAAARWRGENIALRSSGIVWSLAVVSRPLLTVLTKTLGPASAAPDDSSDPTSEGAAPDLGLSIDSVEEVLDEREERMIRGVVQLDQTTAREIMVPRVDMVAAELGTSLEEVAEKMMESGYSRIPVYQDDLDHIEGIAYARDVLGHLSRENGSPATLVTGVIRPALFIPESKTLEELLTELQEKRVHIAIVIDEYGGVSGLVTIEDLLEEIVGEIRDEFDVGEPETEVVSPNEFLMDARAGIDELNEMFNVVVEADGFDTVGGFIYHRLGKIPSTGDLVEYDGLKIEVVSTVGRRVKRLRVTRSTS